MAWRDDVRKIWIAAFGTLLGSILLGIWTTIFPDNWPGWLRWLQSIGEAVAWVGGKFTFAVPVPIWAVAVGLAGTIWWWRRSRRAATLAYCIESEELKREVSRLTSSHVEVSEKLQECEAQLQLAKSPKPNKTAKLIAPEQLELSKEEKDVLNVLLHKHPHDVTLTDVFFSIRAQTEAHVEQLIDILVAKKIAEAGIVGRAVVYRLTKWGRDAAIWHCDGMPPPYDPIPF